ncbi:MAG: RNA-directed DNA polymerase [Clostridia bacterium]|nr:RNA-directed DNA polymerase [Clostridia bacterium]
MNRDYSSITEEISITGFFSEYLPPCFGISKKFLKHTPKDKCDLIQPLCFTMSRFNVNESRRNIFIPEFGSYSVLSNYIKKENIIQELVEFCESENSSFSPILSTDDKIVRHEQAYDKSFNSNSSTYIDNIIEKIIRSTGAKKILKLDISNCFSSFYIHMIPSILLGYEKAEDEYKKQCRKDPDIDPVYLKYKKLDELIRQQNLNQTNGLLVGTQYSKIISEGILTRIDIELKMKNIKFSRYVDDYEVYLYEDNEKQVISSFEKVLKKYGFSLNHEKTEIIDFPYYVTENLEKIFNDSSNRKLNDAELMNLFNTFLNLEKSGIKGAIRYLLKNIENNPIDVSDYILYKSYLLTIIKNNERSLAKACLLLIENQDTMPLDSTDIELLQNLIGFYIQNNRELEVIWLTYLLIETNNMKKYTKVIDLIIKSDNELAQMLLIRKMILNDSQRTIVINKCNSWIALYELYAMDFIDETKFVEKLSINKNLNMYNYFKNENLHFIY